MTALRILALMLLATLAATHPASAHRLKVFATVEDGAVAGYGFFVGGGRVQGATVIMRGPDGKDLWRGETGEEGRFSWHPDNPMPVTVIIDSRDGHVAEATIAADRFAGAVQAQEPGLATAEQVATTGGTAPAMSCAATPDAAALAAMVDRAADKAVERQLRPLLEAYEESSGAIRFNDIVGGVGMIIGMAGIGMWALSRRHKPSGKG